MGFTGFKDSTPIMRNKMEKMENTKETGGDSTQGALKAH